MKNFYPLISLLVFLLLALQASAQCTITSAEVVCEGELIQFQATAGAGIQSLTWDFGDGKSGTQNPVSHQYSTTGAKTVKVVINLTGGGTCLAEKIIMVHSKPKAALSVDPSSSFCLSVNNVCLNDSSLKGPTGGKISTRTILWGDGDRSTTSDPSFGSQICHTYLVPGNFTITIEVVNEHGCKTKQDIQVVIKKDYVTDFSFTSEKKDCDFEEICFENDSAKGPSDMDSFYWDFGDGNTDNSSFSKVCHLYRSKGSYTARLVVVLKNGCRKIIEHTVDVDFPELKFDVTTSAQTVCFPGKVTITQNVQFGKLYTWKWVDSSGKSELFSQYNEGEFVPPCPGKYYIKLKLQDGNCIKEVIVDTIYAVGVMPVPIARNAIQCTADDTVFFCHDSKTYRTNNVEYFWDFGDASAPSCTTNMAKGQNLNSNCNFWLGEEAKHKYPPNSCTEFKLIARDKQNGCVDSAFGNVVMKKPVKGDFKVKTKKACVGLSPDYLVQFTKPDCLDSLWVNLDSACNKDSFVSFKKNNFYSKVCDSTGWVTVGFITKVGNEKIYRSCDPLDFYYSTDNVCYDTFWFHRWFQMQKPPLAIMSLTTTNCLPVDATVKPSVRKQKDIRYVHVTWGDGGDTLVNLNPNDSLPDFTHTYTRAGIYNLRFYLETDSGCFDASSRQVTVGYFNQIAGKDVMCPGDTMLLWDSLHYWGDNTNYWRISSRPEKFVYDLADGRGFVDASSPVVFRASAPGNYVVKMASKDQKSCVDTAYKTIHVTDVTAGIKRVTKRIICDDILQLFDSSSSTWAGDTVMKHYWEFGDQTTPSYLKNPFHFYRNYGDFTVLHIVETEIGCKDTTTIDLYIDGPVAHFDIVSDTVGCEPFTATFKNNSRKSADFIWDFGDGTTYYTQRDTNVSHTFAKAGIYYIGLSASDSITNPDNHNQIYFCTAQFPDSARKIIRRIVVLPIPKVDFDVVGNACAGKDIVLRNQSDSIYDQFRWLIGARDTFTLNNDLNFKVADSGRIKVKFYPTYKPEGPYERHCFDSITKDIHVHAIFSEFSFVKDSICPEYTFTSLTPNSSNILWDFGHPTSENNESTQATAVHNYAPDSGRFEVCLIVKGEQGCSDTSCQFVDSKMSQSIKIPNVFTPNQDGYNDEYEIAIENESLYDLTIYNRWGEKIYRLQQDASIGSGLNWDGTDGNGKVFPEGTYFYVLNYSFNCIDKVEQVQGTITLIRD